MITESVRVSEDMGIDLITEQLRKGVRITLSRLDGNEGFVLTGSKGSGAGSQHYSLRHGLAGLFDEYMRTRPEVTVFDRNGEKSTRKQESVS